MTTLATAVTELAAFGVNVGALTYAYDPVVPLGSLITSLAQYLSDNYAGQYIPLTVSNGQAPPTSVTAVPNVVGMFYQDALQALGYWGLLVNLTLALSDTVLPQYVISQSIAAGTQVAQQTQVTITVSGFTVLQQPGIPTAVL
jgi:beta-lactam-binding protein with PASTA domain